MLVPRLGRPHTFDGSWEEHVLRLNIQYLKEHARRASLHSARDRQMAKAMQTKAAQAADKLSNAERYFEHVKGIESARPQPTLPVPYREAPSLTTGANGPLPTGRPSPRREMRPAMAQQPRAQSARAARHEALLRYLAPPPPRPTSAAPNDARSCLRPNPGWDGPLRAPPGPAGIKSPRAPLDSRGPHRYHTVRSPRAFRAATASSTTRQVEAMAAHLAAGSDRQRRIREAFGHAQLGVPFDVALENARTETPPEVVESSELQEPTPEQRALDSQVLHFHDILKEKIAIRFHELRRAYRLIDQDKSGSADRKELATMLQDMFNLNIPKPVMDRLLDLLDFDDDGEIRLDEFNKFFTTTEPLDIKKHMRMKPCKWL